MGDTDELRPEDIVEDGVRYLASKFEDTRLHFLESVYEGLLLMRYRPGSYFEESRAAWIVEHYDEILEAARMLIRLERDHMSGRIH